MFQDAHGLRRDGRIGVGGAGVRPRGDGLSRLSRRHSAAHGGTAGSRPGIRPGALPEGLLRHAVLQAGCGADGRGGRRGRRGAAPNGRRRASVRMSRRCRIWIDGEPDRAAAIWEQILGEHPRDVLAFRLAHFVNFWLGRPDVMLASVLGVERHWSAGLPGYGADPRLSLLRPRGMRQLHRGGGRGPRGDRPRSQAICGRRMAWRTCWRCRAGAAKASPGSTALRANWEDGQQPAAPSLVARRDVPSGARRHGSGAGAVRRRLPQSGVAADPGAARPLYRRAERRLDAVSSATTRRRCRRSLGGTGRQGRGAHRRLPVGVHLAALDDGAGGHRPIRGGRSHAGWRCATFAQGPGSIAALVGRLCAADLRGGAGARARASTHARSRRCGRRWAACTGWAAATRSRTCWNSCSWMRRCRPTNPAMRGCCWSASPVGTLCHSIAALATQPRRNSLHSGRRLSLRGAQRRSNLRRPCARTSIVEIAWSLRSSQ